MISSTSRLFKVLTIGAIDVLIVLPPQEFRPLGSEGRAILTRRSVRRGEPRVRGTPDSFDAAARADEQSGGCQRYKRHQKRVLNQVLAQLICDEILKPHVGVFPGLAARTCA
jgi:hypothetical protein